jgi:capsular exopolysaccharide synthesis family protein
MSKFFETLKGAERGEIIRRDESPSILIPPNLAGHRSQFYAGEPSESFVSYWLAILRKHWKLSAIVSASVMLAAVIVILVMDPVYEPAAQVQIDPPGAELFSIDTTAAGSFFNSGEFIETQSKNLQADGIAIDVIRAMHLDQNPEIVPPSGVFRKAIRAVRNVLRGKKQGSAVDDLAPAEQQALLAFQERLTVRHDMGSRLLFVSFATNDPKLSADIANTLVKLFIDKTYREKHSAILLSTEWLSRQLDDIREKTEKSNQALVEFQQRTGIIGVGQDANTFSQQVADLNRQYTAAQADRIQLQSYLDRGPQSLPQFRNHPVSTFLTQRLADVRSQLSQAQVTYGKNHPNVKKLQQQESELQSELNAQQKATLAELRTDYAAARAREELMESQKRETSRSVSDVAQYLALQKEAQTNAELYNSLYSRVKAAGIAAASTASSIRLIDPARVLDVPTRPKPILYLMVAFLGAICAGLGTAFAREQLDKNTVRTPQDIRDWLGANTVSVLPAFKASRSLLSPRSLMLPSGKNGNHLPEKFLLDRPHSAEAEALRSLFTSIMLSRPGRPFQVLQIASAFSGEGKTTVAINLAIALAQHGPTCLVDGDVRGSRIAAAFGLEASCGLIDVLLETVPVKDALIKETNVHNLTVLPAGARPTSLNQISWIEPLREVVRSLRERFEFVIMDSPPVLTCSDARVISTLVDGIVFVGRFGSTKREAVVRSMELLSGVNSAPIIEVVLNAAKFSSSEYLYYDYRVAA